jgi:uncharacterized protein YqjF (DUF2071 family)
MIQRWSEVLFAHWPLPVETVAPLIPAGLTLDTRDGMAWIGVVPFRMAFRLAAVPGVWIRFLEINVRTYVTVGHEPGVYFFSLDASDLFSVCMAKTLYHLPYYHAQIHSTVEPDGGIAYQSHRHGPDTARFRGTYRPTGEVIAAPSGSMAHWLTERYRLYTTTPSGQLRRAEIHHPPWPLMGVEAELFENTMALPLNLALEGPPATLHYAPAVDVLSWPLQPAILRPERP